MIISVTFDSLEQFKKRRPTVDTVVVSILDQSERTLRPRLAGWRSVLSLDFEDVSEESQGHSPGSWPLEPEPSDWPGLCVGAGERPPALADARKIVSFVRTHHQAQEPLHLVVHCRAGISRSAAVASWVSSVLWVPLTLPPDRDTDYANKRVLRLLDIADNRR